MHAHSPHLPPRATRLVLLFVAVATLGACRGELRLPFWDPPPGRKIVGHVDIHGNDALSDGDIEDRLHTHSDNWVFFEKPLLDLADVAADATRIESLYAAEGFFGARVTSYDVEPIDDDAVRVNFYLEEGAPTIVRHVGIVGMDDHEGWDDPERERALHGLVDDLLPRLPVHVGERWTESLHETTKLRIVEELVRMGFVHVQLFGEVRVAREANRCDVIYRVWPGPLTRIRDVTVNGNVVVDDERILRRSELVVGKVPLQEDLDRTRANVYALGVFYSVTVKVAVQPIQELLGGKPRTWANIQGLRPEREVTVEIGVNETAMNELRLGGGVEFSNVRSEVFLRTGYQNRNLLGGLQHLDISARPAFVVLPAFWDVDEIGFGLQTEITFRQPSFIEEYTYGSLTADYELGVHYGYRSHSVGGYAAVSRAFLNVLSVELGYGAEFYSYFDVEDALKLPKGSEFGLAFADQSVLGFLQQLVTLDLRDDPIDASRGIFFQVRAQQAQWWLGSDFDFVRLTGDLRGYVTPWKHLTLGVRLKYGQTFPLGTGVVPLAARIYGGGSADMRGYGAGAMGVDLCQVTTCSEDIDVRIGGNIGLLASFETRWDFGLAFPWDIGLVAFVDVGQVWATIDDVALETLDVAVGPGLRYATPVGPLRIDVGFLVKPAILRVPEIHIAIGQAF